MHAYFMQLLGYIFAVFFQNVTNTRILCVTSSIGSLYFLAHLICNLGLGLAGLPCVSYGHGRPEGVTRKGICTPWILGMCY